MNEQGFTNGTTLLLVRHGETDANVAGTWQGATDDPLNQRGLAQARALAERLAAEETAVAAIYASPLQRARGTAQVLAERLLPGSAVRIMPGLAEYHLGQWEGSTYEDLRHQKRLWERMAADPHFAPPGGESAVAFTIRVVAALKQIAAACPGRSALVVGHGGALATALAVLLLGDGNRWPAYRMSNCAVSELAFDPQPRLLRLNETAHLEAVGFQADW